MSSSRRSRSRRWKKVLGNLVVIGLGVVALLLLIGLFLPRNYRVQRSIRVQARPEAVYAQLSVLRQWPEWTVWNQERDPGVRFEYEGPEAGVGATYRWTGAKLGRGQLKLTKAEPTKGVWYELEFDGGQMKATGSLTFEAAGDGLEIVWFNEGDLGRNPVSRYMGLFMERLVGPDFEGSLERLQGRLQSAGGRP